MFSCCISPQLLSDSNFHDGEKHPYSSIDFQHIINVEFFITRKQLA